MIPPQATELLFAPADELVEAHIVTLAPEIAELRIHRDWWNDPWLKDPLIPSPIDRYWNWNEMEIEFEGRELASQKLVIVTGDQAVQGAMMSSTEPVPSLLQPGANALFVELLFTAPRNRPDLRRDGRDFYIGVGKKLLTWAALLSREMGHEGRLRLDSSPQFVTWYQRRGLQKLAKDPIMFEGVTYTPMELSAESARRLMQS